MSMLETGLLETMIPELSPLRGVGQGIHHHLDVLNHTLTAFEHLETILSEPDRYWPDHIDEIREYLARDNKARLLKLTILLHDLGKPASKTVDDSGEIHFHGHEKTGLEPAGRVMDRLRLGNDVKAFVSLMIRHHLRPFYLLESHYLGRLTPRAVHRLGRDLGNDIWGLLIHALADAQGTLGPAGLEHGGPDRHEGIRKPVHRRTSLPAGTPVRRPSPDKGQRTHGCAENQARTGPGTPAQSHRRSQGFGANQRQRPGHCLGQSNLAGNIF
jgi:hypothetical protein